ncbi:hypothetical protein [Pseudomonas typographi]|nr:hypothetical protein [Pseudomonas typographi]
MDNPAMNKKGFADGLANYGDTEFSLFLRKAFIKGGGLFQRYARPADHRHLQQLQPLPWQPRPTDRSGQARHLPGRRVADGIPTISITEAFPHPTSMYLRNLMAMDTEEMLRAHAPGCSSAVSPRG